MREMSKEASAPPVTIVDLKRVARDGETHFATIHAQVDKATQKTTKSGKPFLDWLLRDADESLAIKVWDNHPNFSRAEALGSGSFVSVIGHWSAGKYGLESQDWNLRELRTEEVEALLAAEGGFANQQREDYSYLEAQIEALNDPRLRTLAAQFLEKFGERFRRTAAARDYHHARRGGLVEHVAQMMRSANALCDVYTEVNRELVLTGVLFHDCGKLWENCFPEKGFSMPYSEIGELVGHIPMGMEIVNKLWREMEEIHQDDWAVGSPPAGDVRLHLLHLIASHHGEHSFGSPTLPKTPEAQLLHYIDNIDAKMEMFRGGYLKAQPLAAKVFERVRPLPGNLVQPLATFTPLETDPTSPPENASPPATEAPSTTSDSLK